MDGYRLLTLTTLTALLAGPAAPSVAPGAAKQRVPEAYERDARLTRKRIRLGPAVGTRLKAAVHELSTAAGVSLKCDFTLGSRPVVLSVRGERSTVEFMRALEVAVSARWVPAGPGYALTRIPELAHLAGLDEEELVDERIKASRKLLDSLSPQQRAWLERGEKLDFASLDAEQKQQVLAAAAAALAYDPVTYHTDALQGRGIYLDYKLETRECPSGETQQQRVVYLHLPSPILGSEEASRYVLP